jgi:hypothetical protein
MLMTVFGADGIRGRVKGCSIAVEIALRMGKAMAASRVPDAFCDPAGWQRDAGPFPSEMEGGLKWCKICMNLKSVLLLFNPASATIPQPAAR